MLESSLVILNPMDLDDVSDTYVGWLNDPETFRYLGTKFGQTNATVRAYVERMRPPSILSKIVERASGAHVGNIALHSFDPVHRNAELGIMIGVREARGRGLGREACRLLIAFAFDHLNLHKVTAGTVEHNVGMAKVFESLGFDVEGRLIEHYYLEGRYHDVLRFGLRRERFTAERTALQ